MKDDLRYFAGCALTGLVSDPDIVRAMVKMADEAKTLSHEIVAQTAVGIAIAMVDELEKY